jgi:signal transduction histidine kinase
MSFELVERERGWSKRTNGDASPLSVSPLVSDQQGLVDLAGLSMTSSMQAARRLVAAGYAERERIERDLHDGAQQRLTGVRIRLAEGAERFHEDAQIGRLLRDLGREVQDAIDELRQFAHGVYPELLTSGGLSAALGAAGRRAAQPARVHTRGVERYPPEVEIAVYFTCLAAMDNAAKHAGPAHVTVRVWQTADALHFTVRDTGRGFDSRTTPAGVGIRNMRDRIATAGGTLTIDSTPAHGTRVEGSIPHTPRGPNGKQTSSAAAPRDQTDLSGRDPAPVPGARRAQIARKSSVSPPLGSRHMTIETRVGHQKEP